jgi:hypothetical protein
VVANTAADPAVIKYLQKRLREPDIQRTIESLGIDTVPPKNNNNFLKTETVKIKKLVQEFNITQ